MPIVTAVTFSTLYNELASRLQDTGSSPIWATPRKKEFINAAIRHANARGVFRLVTDVSLVVVANQVEYTLPAAVEDKDALFLVEVEGTTTNNPYREEPLCHVEEKRTYAGAPSVESVALTLVLDKAFAETAGKKIRLSFVASHQELSADGDTTSLPEEYALAHAIYLANSEIRASANADRDWHRAEAQKWFQIAEKHLTDYKMTLPELPARVVPMVW